MSLILPIGLILICAIFLLKFLKKFKSIKVGSLTLITGGVKCGKTTLATYLAVREYKKRLRSVKLTNFFRKIFKTQLLELPLLYSNVPLGCPYVPITKDLIQRKVRMRYKSVIYVQEASLFADSRLIDVKDTNLALMLFNKLIGHESRGGCLIYDTQNLGDLHYSIKRSISNYIYVHSTSGSIPFLITCKVRELIHNDEGDLLNVFTKDAEEDMKTVIFSKKIWKYFDTYCYSSLTDDLPVYADVIENDFNSNLKVDNLISFRNELNITIKKDGEADVKK